MQPFYISMELLYKEYFMKRLIIPLLISSCVFATHTLAMTNEPLYTDDEQSLGTHAEININNATAQELATLKGIGSKKAEAIVKYREVYGEFKTLEDLLKVQGIGEQTIKDNISRLKI